MFFLHVIHLLIFLRVFFDIYQAFDSQVLISIIFYFFVVFSYHFVSMVSSFFPGQNYINVQLGFLLTETKYNK